MIFQYIIVFLIITGTSFITFFKIRKTFKKKSKCTGCSGCLGKIT